MKRAIVLFPDFENNRSIQSIRTRFDPLADYIAPHLTLVFPFESARSTEELKQHMTKALQGVKRFSVQLGGVTGDFREGYLFLNVKRGNDSIIDLHDRLYGDLLAPYLFRKVTYCPHLTLGKLEEATAFDRALAELSLFSERFEATIDRVYVENIDAAERSSIECSISLE